MALPLKSHFRARLVVLFCGLVAAFVGFSLLPRWHEPGSGLCFMPVLVFGGAYIVQLVLGNLVPAQCPNCGADSAVPAGSNLAQYVCKACGTEVNALQSFVAKLEARAAAAPPPPEPAPAQEAQTGSRWVKGLLVIAATCIGIAIWLGDESIRLALGG